MDTSIGFLKQGTHKLYLTKRVKIVTKSPYCGVWSRLHVAAVRGTADLRAELQIVEGQLSCPFCVKHMQEFASDPKNKRWLLHDPEFYVYKLHSVANANARAMGEPSTLPPPYLTTIKFYRHLRSAISDRSPVR